MTDVSAFADVFDHVGMYTSRTKPERGLILGIAMMVYDVWGSWSTGGVGPNAPLDDSCAPTKAGSAESAVDAWTAAGFPANKVRTFSRLCASLM